MIQGITISTVGLSSIHGTITISTEAWVRFTGLSPSAREARVRFTGQSPSAREAWVQFTGQSPSARETWVRFPGQSNLTQWPRSHMEVFATRHKTSFCYCRRYFNSSRTCFSDSKTETVPIRIAEIVFKILKNAFTISK